MHVKMNILWQKTSVFLPNVSISNPPRIYCTLAALLHLAQLHVSKIALFPLKIQCKSLLICLKPSYAAQTLPLLTLSHLGRGSIMYPCMFYVLLP